MPERAILKKHREKLGLTQQQVADIASINIRQYQRFESGERRISGTSFRIGAAIADILELDVHELVYNHTVEAYLKEKKEMERLKNQSEEE
ncbi:helix-turn-helix domain-containing protein [Pelotomaculum terephthalicicum JT]|uniref:helix-turn-helix domain-containing protein n=1 Tax=Pelotomaculum TaxID=191373 RepID=UPI0009D167EB|nr:MULTISPECIES: helix-turn-helix transcriptional regulator [Pelotomaculum]MCG9968679.1 helix-turn-helix domain-containing protein [Pelotomaculum terephthalicicum JT]OPX85676.1 MAG: Helix-turn-helix domain protein [Pelotomaculum sp. PtaB.Bin117]OPY62007.1 MAG: Helix-turn-helix domain protein [Pelotomaculum sp. PtaU1.Bin065]